MVLKPWIYFHFIYRKWWPKDKPAEHSTFIFTIGYKHKNMFYIQNGLEI